MIYLEPIEYKDLEQLRIWRNDERIYRNCRQYAPISKEYQDMWFEKQTDNPSLKMFAIFIHMDIGNYQKVKTLVGACGLTSIDYINRNAEYSLYIAPKYQGKGFSRKVMHKLISFGFNSLNLHMIWGEIFDFNQISLKIALDLGFKLDGKKRQCYYKEGRYIDAFIVTLIHSEYKKENKIEKICLVDNTF